MDADTLKTNITSGAHWLRLLYMILFAVLLYFAGVVMVVVVVLQFLFALLSGSANDNLRRFGESLSRYIFQALQFLTYNSERKPFPFSDWPGTHPEVDPVAAHAETGAPQPKPAPRRRTPTAKAKAKPKSASKPAGPEDAGSVDQDDDNKPV